MSPISSISKWVVLCLLVLSMVLAGCVAVDPAAAPASDDSSDMADTDAPTIALVIGVKGDAFYVTME